MLLPGLGCDARSYKPQSNQFQNLICPIMPDEESHDSLATFALKCVDLWFGEHSTLQFDRKSPVVLGGAGLGGMLALEVALQVASKYPSLTVC